MAEIEARKDGMVEVEVGDDAYRMAERFRKIMVRSAPLDGVAAFAMVLGVSVQTSDHPDKTDTLDKLLKFVRDVAVREMADYRQHEMN